MKGIDFILFNKKPIFLAPMDNITDSCFRQFCKEIGGVDVCYTEFVSADGIKHNLKRLKEKILFTEEERPIGIQIYGHNIENMVYAAKVIEEFNPDFIDINLGCPSRKISNRGAGSGLLRDLDLLKKISKAIVDSVKLPVTAKTRLGWDENNINVLDVALILQDIGIKWLVIHGRTRSQMFKGKANWDYIKYVKNHPKVFIPIIGNGDINSPEFAKYCFDEYNVDGIMIGRHAIGNPWIFKQIHDYLETGSYKNYEMPAKIDLFKKLLLKKVEKKGEKYGIISMRIHFANLLKNLPNIREMKIKLLTSSTLNEVLDILEEIKNKYDNF